MKWKYEKACKLNENSQQVSQRSFLALNDYALWTEAGGVAAGVYAHEQHEKA